MSTEMHAVLLSRVSALPCWCDILCDELLQSQRTHTRTHAQHVFTPLHALADLATQDQLAQFALPEGGGAQQTVSATSPWRDGGAQSLWSESLPTGSTLPDLSTDMLHSLLDDADSTAEKMSGSWRHDAAAESVGILGSAPSYPDFSYFSSTEPQITPAAASQQHRRVDERRHHHDASSVSTNARRHTSVPVVTGAPLDRANGGSPLRSGGGPGRGIEMAELLAEAARRVAAIVEDYRHASAPLGFQFQERIIGALDDALVKPLLDATASTAALLRDDVRAAEERARTLTLEASTAQHSKEQLESQVRAVIEAGNSEGLLDTDTNAGGGHTVEEQLTALANLLGRAASDRREAGEARRLADEAAARKERELQSEVASLRKRLDEQSAHAARESVRASDLAAQLDAARVAEEVRAFFFVRARTHVFFSRHHPLRYEHSPRSCATHATTCTL
jgi:hypothetical protein